LLKRLLNTSMPKNMSHKISVWIW